MKSLTKSMILLLVTILLIAAMMLSGCACFCIKTPEIAACYCRAGDQSIEYKEFSQESEGKAPSGFFGMLLEFIK